MLEDFLQCLGSISYEWDRKFTSISRRNYHSCASCDEEKNLYNIYLIYIIYTFEIIDIGYEWRLHIKIIQKNETEWSHLVSISGCSREKSIMFVQCGTGRMSRVTCNHQRNELYTNQ